MKTFRLRKDHRRKQQRLVYINRDIYARLRPVNDQLKKDGALLYLHTIDENVRSTLENLMAFAIEWFCDCYDPIETTPAERIAEFGRKRCPECGHDYPRKPQPHMDWGPIDELS